MSLIVVTGSAGLIGRSLLPALTAAGHDVVGYDLMDGHDVRDRAGIAAAMRDCDGVVHLAAVSRVRWGEDDPVLCRETNIGGTEAVIAGARGATKGPWMVLASSREVYGEPEILPVAEDAPLMPLNVYARTKVAAEARCRDATDVDTAIVRLSNVYGDVQDHADRVVPAFLRAAVSDGVLRVEGSDHLFDFTHVDDVVRGLVALADGLSDGRSPPPIHFVSGQGTTLGELARFAITAGGGGRTVEAPPRTYDVQRFVGDGTRAGSLLGWREEIPLVDGLAVLADRLRRPSGP